MITSNIIKKGLVLGAIFLFLSTALCTAIGTSIIKEPLGLGDAPIPIIEGVMGENNWYVSDVDISFSYDPKDVEEIQYYLNGAWHIFTGPFRVDIDGTHNIQWFWIDADGKNHDGNPIFFRLDKSPPTIKLNKNIGNSQIIFSATCSDSASGVKQVDFYLDDEYVQTVEEEPYNYVWTGLGVHYVHAVGTNYAGLTIESDKLDTKAKARTFNIDFLNIIFQRFLNIVLKFQQINL